MGSFKLKLVVYFLLLAFVPLAAGYWGFSSIAASSQTRQVDARLQSSLRAGLAAGQAATTRFGDRQYRAVASAALEGAPGTKLAVLTPQSRITSASTRTERRLLAALLATLVLVGLVAWLEGRAIVRSVRRLVRAANAIARGDLDRRVPVHGRDELALLARSFNEMAEQLGARLQELRAERQRLRDAITLFGEALAATHDVEQLLRVVLDVQIEATGATGGFVIVDGGDVVQVGDIDGDDRIEVPLNAGRTSCGRIVLIGAEFDDEDRITAVSLAAHAVVALDNARLHRIVEQQARRHALTGLAPCPAHGTAEGLVAAADSALYEAKNSGTNRVETAREPARRP